MRVRARAQGADWKSETTGAATLWRGRRASPFASLRLAGMRLTRSWRLLLAVTLGMLVATTLICAVPLFNTVVADTQLRKTVTGATVADRNIDLQVQSLSVATKTRADASRVIARQAQPNLTSFTAPAPVYFLTSGDLLLGGVNKAPPPTNFSESAQATRFEAFDYSVAGPHIHLLAGALPQAGSALPQALITQETAQTLGVGVGSTLTSVQYGDHSKQLTVRVAGVWSPTDDPFWNEHSFRAMYDPNKPNRYPLLVTYDDLFSQLADFGGVSMTQHWVYQTRVDALTVATMQQVASNIGNVRSQLAAQLIGVDDIRNATIGTQLDALLIAALAQQRSLALPLAIIVAQVVGLALLFVAAMASLLVESQSQDLVTLKSRGASAWQTLGLLTWQSALLALFTGLVAPVLAALLALELADILVPGAEQFGARIGPEFLTRVASPLSLAPPALVGMALGVGTVAATALTTARQDVLAFRREQGRPARPPFWRRYYLDLALVALCVIGYIELGQFGGAQAQLGSAGGPTPLLLLTPALLLLAGGLLLLRLFPVIARLGARLTARGDGLVWPLVFSQFERTPGRYSRLALLLALAVGLGAFALTFDASLQSNVRDRAAYAVGSDLRVTQVGGEGNGQGQTLEQQFAQFPGVRAVSPLYRTKGRIAPDERLDADVLGIDPATFGQVADVSWRSDYASKPLSAELAQMRAHSRSEADGPIWALISQTSAAAMHISVGQTFALQINEVPFANLSFVVGDIVSDFPTLYPGQSEGGFVVVDLADYIGKLNALQPDLASQFGPNEFWLRTSGAASDTNAILARLGDSQYGAQRVAVLRDQLAIARSNPTTAGIEGLLLTGAVTAGALAVLGIVIQSLVTTGQRARQFAVLRTIGVSRGQVTRILLGEQLTLYLLGVACGGALGLLLASATLPFLTFSDAQVDSATLGVPPDILQPNPQGLAALGIALLAACTLALAISARYAATLGLGSALRLGED